MRCRGDVRSNRRGGFPQDLVKKRIKATGMTETAEGHGSEAGKTGRLQAVREREERLRERIAEESHEITAVHGHEMEKGDIFKFRPILPCRERTTRPGGGFMGYKSGWLAVSATVPRLDLLKHPEGGPRAAANALKMLLPGWRLTGRTVGMMLGRGPEHRIFLGT